jgi:hypothetical protein
MATGGKLSVRDFHMIGSFPLFEGIYTEMRISNMSYAEKVSNGNKLLRCLNETVGTAPAPQAMVAPAQPAPAQPTMVAQPAANYSGIEIGGTTTGMARTQCVGGVADNSIGDIPSVKVHHAPGGSSSLTTGGATMASLGGMDASAVQNFTQEAEPTRTRCTGGTASNAIGSVPSVRVHAAPGGSSSISLGGDIDSTTAPASDKSDMAAITFLQQTNAKFATEGKLSVRDFHMIGSFPLFENVYADMQLGSMSYAEKVNSSGKLMLSLNALVGEPAARAALAPQSTNSTAAPVANECVEQQGVPSRTHCVGGVADNTIGDVPSVKIHHAPGGSSSIQLW